MVEPETDTLNLDKLVKNAPELQAKYSGRKGTRAKVTNGRIRSHWVKGKTYYYYVSRKAIALLT